MISFASDNNAGAHPNVLKAMEAANTGSVPAYGDDAHTMRALHALQEAFGADARAYFVFLGTAANVLALASCTRSHEAILCSSQAHIHTDECGAMERFGRKLCLLPQREGKIRHEDCLPFLDWRLEVHHPQPRIVSISQVTELGTVYTREEIAELAAFCHSHDLYLHMDGARIANAAAAQGLSLREATRDLGVDVLSFGGTKNGLMLGEAVIFFNPELGGDFPYLRKQGMQLGSKMRFIAAQFEAYMENELWRKNAEHANAMAALLAESVKTLPGIELCARPQANAVFARLKRKAVTELQKQYYFYVWDEHPDGPGDGPDDRQEVRWMTSFATTPEQVRAFSASIAAVLK